MIIILKRSCIIYIFLMLFIFCACGEIDTTDESPKNTDIVQKSENKYEEVIDFYEQLCDAYGFLTYEMVYYPEKWSNYIPSNSNVYHKDWLCPNFDNCGDYRCSANVNYEENYSNYTLCKICGETEYCFLDTKEGIIHSQKENLKLGTEDFLTCDVNYRFVSEERAIECGYSCCECCTFK